MFKRLIHAGFTIILCVVLLSSALPAQAVSFTEDFEGQPMGVLADNLVFDGAAMEGNWSVTSFASGFMYLDGQVLTREVRPLTIFLDEVQEGYCISFARGIGGPGDPLSITIEGYLNGQLVFVNEHFGTNYVPAPFPIDGGTWEGLAELNDSEFDALVIDIAAGIPQATSIDNISIGDAKIFVPHLGEVMITQAQAQPAYSSPAGSIVTDAANNPLIFPADADNNGFDTYVVTGWELVGNEMWISIFVGNQIWVWVPLSGVTPVTPLDIPSN